MVDSKQEQEIFYFPEHVDWLGSPPFHSSATGGQAAGAWSWLELSLCWWFYRLSGTV